MKIILFSFLAVVCLLANRSEAMSVLTQKYDNNRTGATLTEAILTPRNVSATTFGKVFEIAVDGQLIAQPLIVEGLSIGGKTRTVVFLVTAKNVAYAFDAEDLTTSSPLWKRNLGNRVPSLDVYSSGWADITPVVGTVDAPVIDTNAGTIFFVTGQKDYDGTYSSRLQALDILTGNDRKGSPVEVTATASGVTFDPAFQMNRPGLLLQNNRLYIAYGSYGDNGAYHGWILAYNPSTLAQTARWLDTPTGKRGGIWMSGGGLVGDGTNVYVTTGNGDFNADTGGSNYGETCVGLNSNLTVLTWFTPHNWAELNGGDKDFGVGSLVLIPGTRRIVSPSKEGKLFSLNADNMGGFNATTDACLQVVDVANGRLRAEIHSGMVYWNSPAGQLLYEVPMYGQFSAYRYTNGLINAMAVWQSAFVVPDGSPGGQISLSANGTANGILWATHPTSLDAAHDTVPGTVRAFNATTGQELWNSDDNPNDTLGNFAKYDIPVVHNGKVYVPTFSDKLVVYGLLPQGRVSPLPASPKL